MRTRGFTLIELIIVVFVLSAGLIVIIKGITDSQRYISETAQKTIALNLAKEGIEAVYNIRNSNWRRWSSQRDKCWLKADPTGDNGRDGCEDDGWMKDGKSFLIKTQKNQFTLGWIGEKGKFKSNLTDPVLKSNLKQLKQSYDLHLKNRFTNNNYEDGWKYYLLHYIPSKGRIDFASYWGLTEEEKLKEVFSNGVYARYIIIDQLYDKQTGGPIDCENGDSDICGSTSAKELRFCSIVHYIAPYEGNIKICSIMTNFQK